MTFERFFRDYQDTTPPLDFLILSKPVEVEVSHDPYAIVALATTSRSPDGLLCALAVSECDPDFRVTVLTRTKPRKHEDPNRFWILSPSILSRTWVQTWFKNRPHLLIQAGIRLERWAVAKRQPQPEQPKQ